MWTTDETKLLRKLYPQGDVKTLTRRLRRPLTAIRQKAYSMGIRTDAHCPWSAEEVTVGWETFGPGGTPAFATEDVDYQGASGVVNERGNEIRSGRSIPASAAAACSASAISSAVV